MFYTSLMIYWSFVWLDSRNLDAYPWVQLLSTSFSSQTAERNALSLATQARQNNDIKETVSKYEESTGTELSGNQDGHHYSTSVTDYHRVPVYMHEKHALYPSGGEKPGASARTFHSVINSGGDNEAMAEGPLDMTLHKSAEPATATGIQSSPISSSCDQNHTTGKDSKASSMKLPTQERGASPVNLTSWPLTPKKKAIREMQERMREENREQCRSLNERGVDSFYENSEIESKPNLDTFQKKGVSALRELLANKFPNSNHGSGSNSIAVDESSELDEDAMVDVKERLPKFSSTLSPSLLQDGAIEDGLTDDLKRNHTCSVCGQVFQYRSSFRRHMKVHQGIFSHVCAVCNRKFTRKEHFVRHKCSRKPNKASRGAGEMPSTPGKVPRVEFPPPFSDVSTGSSSPDHVFSSPEKSALPSLQNRLLDEPNPENAGPIPFYSHVNPVVESRRKKSHPRKVVEIEEEEDAQFLFSETAACQDEAAKAENISGSIPPMEEAIVSSSVSNTKRNGSVSSVAALSEPQDDDEEGDLERLMRTEDALPDGCCNGDEEGVMDLSQPYAEEPMSQEFTIDSGSYKVVTEGDVRLDGMPQKMIKVIKQGKYLKLKEEAQLIGGQLCFVCPTCGKIFHRSSNFSRHMRIHRGVYSYVCSNCKRGFFRKEHFQKHKCGRRGMAHTWDRKTKVDMALGDGTRNDGSDPGSDIAESEESFHMEHGAEQSPDESEGDQGGLIQYDPGLIARSEQVCPESC